jgi:ribosomal-protein-alanine N-acetyltransferase
MADIVIEAPGVSAASLLAELHGQCFVQAWPETEMAQLLGSPGASAFIAIKASLPTGFLIARQAADEAEIIVVGTCPEARREGIARRLIEAASESLAARAATRLFAEVATGNLPARALHTGMGFREVGMRHGYYRRPDGKTEDAHVMMKDLP